MSCTNCYSGCVEIQSDKCVKYTGLDIPALGITNGDSLNSVTSAISSFLVTTLDGSGIKYELDAENLCDVISDELAGDLDITQRDISNALSAAICGVDARVTVLEDDLEALEADYTPDCVPGITGSEGTKIVLQAVLDHLCTVATDLDALELNISTNYVLISDIDTIISNYISEQEAAEPVQKSKMVPYTVVEYYGPLTVFDASGAGINDWAEIYLCNGDNGTPDKRGRVPVGATSGMGGGVFPSETDPAGSANPAYSLYTTTGDNAITLSSAQMPAHAHTAVSAVTDPGHNHDITTAGGSTFSSGPHIRLESDFTNTSTTQTNTTGITVNTTINSTGGGGSHSNIQPVLACYYIMYIPIT